MEIFDSRTSLLLGVLACFLDFRLLDIRPPRSPFNSTLSLLSIRTILSGSERKNQEEETKFNLCLSLSRHSNLKFLDPSQCMKITEKVSFNIASEASYVYILSGQKLSKNAKNGSFWRVFKNMKITVIWCYQTGQF